MAGTTYPRKIETSDFNFKGKPERINLKGLIPEVITNVISVNHIRNVRISKIINQTRNFTSYNLALETIFYHLIQNSIVFRQRRTGMPCNIEVIADVYPKLAVFIVNDYGIGIAPENLPKVFDLFYRADSQSEGSGMGLYIVKNIVESLGGRIQIHSSVGKGTTIEIEIPNIKKYGKAA